MRSEDGISPLAPRRRGDARETIEFALIAWACCLAVVAAVAIPLLGLARAALIGAGSLVGLVAVCLAISDVRLGWRRRR